MKNTTIKSLLITLTLISSNVFADNINISEVEKEINKNLNAQMLKMSEEINKDIDDNFDEMVQENLNSMLDVDMDEPIKIVKT